MNQYNLNDYRYHCRRLIFCLNSLRYMYVFKIYVRAYFNQQLSVGIYTDQIHLQYFETLIFHNTETIKLQVYNIRVESFTDG